MAKYAVCVFFKGAKIYFKFQKPLCTYINPSFHLGIEIIVTWLNEVMKSYGGHIVMKYLVIKEPHSYDERGTKF